MTILTWIRLNISIVIIVVIGLLITGLYLDVRHASEVKDGQISALIRESRNKDNFIRQYQQSTDAKISGLETLVTSQHEGIDTLIAQLKAANITPAVDPNNHPITTTTTTTPNRSTATTTTTTQPKQSSSQRPPSPSTPPPSAPPQPSSPPSSPPPQQPLPPLPPIICMPLPCIP